MENNKIFVFLPDGIGLRNFAYSDFHDIGKNKDFEKAIKELENEIYNIA